MHNWKSLKIDFPLNLQELCIRAHEAEIALQEVEGELIRLEKIRDPGKTFYIPPKIAFKFKTAIMRAIEVQRRMLKISRIIQMKETIPLEVGDRDKAEKMQSDYEKELKTTTDRLVSFKVLITGYESFLSANMQVSSILNDTYGLLYAAKQRWKEQIDIPSYEERMSYRKKADAELKYQLENMTEATRLFFKAYATRTQKEREDMLDLFYEIASKYAEFLNRLPDNNRIEILSKIGGKEDLKYLVAFELSKGKPEALLKHMTKGMPAEEQSPSADFIAFTNQLGTIQQDKLLKIRGHLNTKRLFEIKLGEMEALYIRPIPEDYLKLLDNILIEILGRAGLIVRREDEFKEWKEGKLKHDAPSTF